MNRSVVTTSIIAFLLFLSCVAQVFAEEEKPRTGFTGNGYYETSDGTYYAISEERGFLISYDQGKTWEQRNNGLPGNIVYPFENDSIRSLTSFSVDPGNDSRIAVTTAFGLFLSSDRGKSWESITLKPPIKSSAYITSVALSPVSEETILVGTSFSGVFETRDRGQSWHKRPEKIDQLYRGAGFYEDISGVAYHPHDNGTIFIACGFGNGLYTTHPSSSRLQTVPFPGAERGAYIEGLYTYPYTNNQGQTEWYLVAETSSGFWYYRFATGEWGHRSFPFMQGKPKPSEEKQKRLETASEKYAIYVGAHNAGGDKLDSYLDFLEEHDFNAIVIDMKNDRGIVTYNTKLALPRKLGAVWEAIDIEQLVEKAHDRGIYVIARLVVFKDRKLYEFQDYKYALWNSEKKRPWGHRFKITDEETGEVQYEQREHWVDPFSRFVWDYNVSIAEELQQRGIDEIQFDYIRFPSDGDTSAITYRYRREGMVKIEAIESFLTRAREVLTIPVSTDLYGFNSWYKMGNWIGQNIEMISSYVDAICPMFYPSHFPRSFMEKEPYLERAQKLYREGSDRAAALVKGKAVIRPYIQAFLMGGELEFEEPTYTRYLLKQIQGTQASRASGFTLWNNSNHYYMVTVPLNKYVQADTDEEDQEEESTLN